MTTAPIAVVHPGDSLSSRQRLTYILILGALTALGPFTIDMYLPSLPTIQSDLSSTTAIVQLTLTATTVGFGVGQLLVGPWSDRIGRRMPLLITTAVHVLSAVGAAVAPNIETLAVMRFLQGMGAAASGVVAVAIARDLFSGRPLVRMLSSLALVNGLAPVIAPVAGSELLLVVPWRGIFWVLGAYGLFVGLCVLFWIIETHTPERRAQLGVASARDSYRVLFHDRWFVGIAIVSALNFTGLFAYLSSATFIFQDDYGFSAQRYGLLFAVNSVGVIIGVQTAGRISHRIAPQWILAASTALCTAMAIVIVVDGLLGAGLWGILIPLWFFIASVALGFPSCQVLGLNGHPREAGTAASLMGAGNFIIAGLVSPLIGLLGTATSIPMGGTMIVTSVGAALALWLVVRPKTVPALGH